MNTEGILINISRGEVLHESDLYHSLKSGSIAFAAIDTWFNYPSKDTPAVFPSKKHEYHLLDNLVLSPHRAGFVEGSFPHLDDAIENLNRCYLNQELINKISLTDKY
jgi:phosphoglycerate dehydrogenase-like enzyme